MKIKITAPNRIFGVKGEDQFGKTLEIKEVPKGWAGAYQVVSDESGKGSLQADNEPSNEPSNDPNKNEKNPRPTSVRPTTNPDRADPPKGDGK